MAGTHKVDIVIEAQNNAKKVLDSLQQSINKLTESIVRSNASLAQNINKVADSVDEIKQSFDRISSTTQKTAQQTEKLHYNWRGLVWTIVRAEIVFRGIMRIVDAIRDYFASMLDTLDEYQMSLLQLSAIQTTLLQSTVKGHDALERLFDRMYSINQSVYQTLMKMSAQTPLTTEQLLRLYRAWLAYGQIVDLSNEKMRQGLLAVANAIYMMSGGFQVNRQLVQETRGLITQTSLAYSDLARFIIRTGIATKEQLSAWAKQNVLLEKMAELLSGFAIGAQRTQETLKGLATTFESELKRRVIANFNSAYDSLRAFLQVLIQSPETWRMVADAIATTTNVLKIFGFTLTPIVGFLHIVLRLLRLVAEGVFNFAYAIGNAIAQFESFYKRYTKLRQSGKGRLEAFSLAGKDVLFKSFYPLKDWFTESKQRLSDLLDLYSKVWTAFISPKQFVTPTNVLNTQAKQLKDFYTLLQSFASSGSKIADEIDQNLSKIGDSLQENFGIKSLDTYIKVKDYLNALKGNIASFINTISKLGEEKGFRFWRPFIISLKELAEGRRSLDSIINSLQKLSKQGKISVDVLDLMGGVASAVAKRVDFLHKKQKQLGEIEKNITNTVLKETKEQLSSLVGSFKSLGAEVERFGIPATTLEAKLKNVDIKFASLQNRITKSISNFRDLRDSIEKASKSTKIPEELRIKLKALLPVLDKYIDKLKEWLGILHEKANKHKEYLKLIEKQRQELFKLREKQAKIEEQYKTAHISAKQYYQFILENLQRQKQAYKERLRYLRKDSQEYISTEEKILQIEKKITDVQLELDKRSNRWCEGLRRTLQQYKDSLEETVSAFSMSSSILASSLRGLEDAFTAVFGDVMLGKLKSFKDYFMIFVRVVVAEISKLIAKLLMLKTIVPFLERVFGIPRRTSTQAILGQALLGVAGAIPTRGGFGAGFSPRGVPAGLLGRLTTAPSMLEANWAFRALSKIPGVQVIRTPEGAQLAIKGVPLSKVLSSAGWASLGYGLLSQITGLPKGAIPTVTSTAGAIGGGIAGASLIGGSLGGPVGAGIGALLGGVLGGLFGGGKHHPGKYSWRIEWSGIHINPRTGEISVATPSIFRTLRAGKPQNQLLGWGFTPQVASYITSLVSKLEQISPTVRRLFIPAIEAVNRQFNVVSFTTHLEALRQQLPAFQTYMKKYYLPALQKAYDDILSKMFFYQQIKGFQEGGLVKGSKRGYLFSGVLHGAEHIVPDKDIQEMKKEFSSIKELLWMLVNTSGDQVKYNKRSYELFLKWDNAGLKTQTG